MILKNLLQEALGNHYPKNHMKIDNVDYKSKVEKYFEWLNPLYINGMFYIGESPTSVVDIQRQIISVWYLKDPTNNRENKYGIGLIVEGFRKSQKVKLLIDNDDEVEYTLTNWNTLNEGQVYYGELLKPSAISKIVYSADEVLVNYVKYSKINATTVQVSNMNSISFSDFKDTSVFLDKLNRIKNIKSKVIHSPRSFTLKFEVLNHDGGVAEFYKNNVLITSISFHNVVDSVHLSGSVDYDLCKLKFTNDVEVDVNINTVTAHDWVDCEYLIKY